MIKRVDCARPPCFQWTTSEDGLPLAGHGSSRRAGLKRPPAAQNRIVQRFPSFKPPKQELPKATADDMQPDVDTTSQAMYIEAIPIRYNGAAMDLKLSVREQDALKKLASLGSMYHLLHNDAATLLACGLVEESGDGMATLTDDGRKYLRTLDLAFIRSQSIT